MSELIGKMHTDETAEGIYLSQGLLGPVFDNREFGMATKMVSRSVAYSYEVKIEEVERVYKATGDLGETVLVIGKSFGDKNLTITEVFDLLKKSCLFGRRWEPGAKNSTLVGAC